MPHHPAKPHLIIIPGLGDRAGRYKMCALWWRLRGYDVHIFAFGWEQAAALLPALHTRLVEYIDTLSNAPCSIIGASAGGTAAINALAARPSRVARVVTLCTPYASVPELGNARLDASVAASVASLQTMNDAMRRRIVSLYALYDGVVPVAKTRSTYVMQRRLFSWGHSLTIALGLTVYSAIIDQYLRRHRQN